MTSKSTASTGLAIAMLTASAPGFSHHSFAMFDMSQATTLHGTVKEIQWTNPHCFLQVLVPSRQGMTEWSIEMHSPSTSRRMRWSRETFKPGDQIAVTIHPARAGAPGGFLVSATGPDGQTHSYGKAP